MAAPDAMLRLLLVVLEVPVVEVADWEAQVIQETMEQQEMLVLAELEQPMVHLAMLVQLVLPVIVAILEALVIHQHWVASQRYPEGREDQEEMEARQVVPGTQVAQVMPGQMEQPVMAELRAMQVMQVMQGSLVVAEEVVAAFLVFFQVTSEVREMHLPPQLMEVAVQLAH